VRAIDQRAVHDHLRVTGVVVERKGKTQRIRARDGVLLATGGYAKNQRLRDRWSRQPSSAEWSISPSTDTGEVIELAISHGAATALIEEAWWIPTAVGPGGHPAVGIGERSKPHSIVVDAGGERFFNEAAPQTEAGRAMYDRQNECGGAIPAWLILESRHRGRYLFGTTLPERTPEMLVTSGFLKRADTLAELAQQCGIDAARLAATVERFNGFARGGWTTTSTGVRERTTAIRATGHTSGTPVWVSSSSAPSTPWPCIPGTSARAEASWQTSMPGYSTPMAPRYRASMPPAAARPRGGAGPTLAPVPASATPTCSPTWPVCTRWSGPRMGGRR
jgi:succinate dehydrogenase/fumarate reductase flavoprotein subunit